MTIPLSYSPIAARLRFERLGPSSRSRIEWFANALRDAYFERRDRLDIAGLLTKINRMLDRENARGGHPSRLLTALRSAFNASDAVALRSDIIHLVEAGDMRPSEAAHWAGQLDLQPFTGWADHKLFDPMKVPMWTLSMTAAWIRWRERDPDCATNQVRRHWPAYIAASTHWIESEDGYEIGPREDQGYCEIPEARTDTKRILRDALESGRFKAERYKDAAFIEIPSSDWSVLNVVGVHDEDGVHRVMANGSEIDVRIPREQVVAAFPTSARDGGESYSLRQITSSKALELLSANRDENGGRVLGKKAAERYLQGLGYRGRDIIRGAVDHLTGGRTPGER